MGSGLIGPKHVAPRPASPMTTFTQETARHPDPSERTMTRIYTRISIQRPIEEVFAYVTTPANWPRWHPSSLGVRGAADHPLEVGEQVTEDFRVAGRCGEVVWTV